MSELVAISEKERMLMSEYNIKTETQRVYFAGGYKYDRLQNAARYAKLSVERPGAPVDD